MNEQCSRLQVKDSDSVLYPVSTATALLYHSIYVTHRIDTHISSMSTTVSKLGCERLHTLGQEHYRVLPTHLVLAVRYDHAIVHGLFDDDTLLFESHGIQRCSHLRYLIRKTLY